MAKEMEKRITKRGDGRYNVAFGYSHETTQNPCGAGFVLAGFISYYETTVDTLRKAERATFKR